MNSVYKLFCGITLLATLATSCATHRGGGERAELESGDYLSTSNRRLFDYLYLEGERYRLQKSDDAAFDLYRQAALIDTLNAPVKYQLANYLVKLNQPQKALDLLREAVALEPDNYWYGTMLGTLLQHTQQYDEAITTYEDIVAKHPKKIEVLYMLTDAYGTKGDMPKAIATLNRIEELTGKNENLSFSKYRLYQSLGDEERAFAEIEELVAAFPSQSSYQFLLGKAYLDGGRTEDALAAYNKAEEIDPNNSQVIIAKSNFFKTIGDKKALEELVHKNATNSDIEVDTKFQLMIDYLTLELKKKGDTTPAYQLFASLIEMHPDSEKLRNLYIQFLLTENNLPEATQQLQELVTLDPSNLDNWLQLMSVQLRQEEYRGVLASGDKAFDYHSDKVGIYIYAGLAAMQLKEYAPAIAVLELGIDSIPAEQIKQKSDLYGQIGDIYHEWGKKAESYQAYDKALELNPDNVSVLNNYSYFLSLDKEELRKAEQMSGKAVKLEPQNATFLDTYAWVFFQQENYMLAKIYLQSALTYGGDKNPDLLEHMGDALFMNDEVEQAIEYWNKALLLNETSEILKQKIKEQRYIAP